jgi:hypothetical protein
MGTEETIYMITYTVPHDKAVKGLDTIETRLLKFENNLDRVAGKLKKFGSDHTGLAKFVTALQAVDSHLKTTSSNATAAQSTLKTVGSGNSGITSITKRLDKLITTLNAVPGAANAAGSSLAGVGGGSGAGVGSGNGAGGGSAKGNGVNKAFAGLHRAMTAYRLAKGLYRAGGQGWENQVGFFNDAAEASGEYRESLRQLATLQGKPDVDNSLMREQLQFGKETGLNPAEASELRLEFGGAVAIGQGKGNITDGVAKDLEKQAAKFGVRTDLDMQTVGRMAGLMANYQKVPSAESGIGVMAESMKQLDKYGVGSVKGMLAPALGLAGSMLEEEGGRFNSFQSMFARMAATTVSTAGNPSIAANQMRQTNRALRKFGTDTEPGEFLRKAGVNEKDSYEQALAKVAPLIAGPNGDQVLIKAGFGNEREREGLIKQSKMSDAVERQLKDPEMAKTRQQAMAQNEAFAATSTGRQRIAESEYFASVIETGINGEKLRAATEAARARMANPNQPGGQRLKAGFFGSLKDTVKSGIAAGALSGEDIRVGVEANEALERGAKSVGIDASMTTYPELYKFTDPATRQKTFERLYDAVEKAGGDPMGGAPAKLKQAAALLNGAANDMQRGKAAGTGGAPPAGNGGAGVNPGRR